MPKPENPADTSPAALAEAILDAWEQQWLKLADDKTLQGDGARLMEPMAQMFAVWQTAMQNNPYGFKPPAFTAPSAASGAAPARAASAGRQPDVDELAARLSALEERFTRLELKIAGKPGNAKNANKKR